VASFDPARLERHANQRLSTPRLAVVEYVERIHAELEAYPLLDIELLLKRHVEIYLARPVGPRSN
jgi:Fe2+ or Zn2+ uptake regulation protein